MPRGELRRPTRFPRVASICSEAARNLGSGTTKAVLFGLAFLAIVGSIAGVQSRSVVDLIVRATQFRDSGAAVQILSAPGAVDAATCDALSSVNGVLASGALRQGPSVTLAALPSRPVGSFEVSPGFSALLAWQHRDDRAGVWVARSLLDEIGARPAESLALRNGSSATVAGAYEYPDDGRDPKLAHQILLPTARSGAFDECWMLIWPDRAAANDVVFLPVIPQDPGPDSRGMPAPALRQLNTSLGESFVTGGAMEGLLGAPLTAIAAVLAGLLGFLAIRLRRLESREFLALGDTEARATRPDSTGDCRVGAWRGSVGRRHCRGALGAR